MSELIRACGKWATENNVALLGSGEIRGVATLTMISRSRERDPDGKIARLKHEIAQLENCGPPLSERLAKARNALEQCEALFRLHGFAVIGVSPSEQTHFGRQQAAG